MFVSHSFLSLTIRLVFLCKFDIQVTIRRSNFLPMHCLKDDNCWLILITVKIVRREWSLTSVSTKR